MKRLSTVLPIAAGFLVVLVFVLNQSPNDKSENSDAQARDGRVDATGFVNIGNRELAVSTFDERSFGKDERTTNTPEAHTDVENVQNASLEDLKEIIYNCYDMEVFEYKRTPSCAVALAEVRKRSSETTDIVEMSFYVSALYTEVDSSTMGHLLDEFERRSGSTKKSDVFELALVGFGQVPSAGAIDNLYKLYWTLDKEVMAEYVPIMSKNALLFLSGNSTRGFVEGHARDLLNSIPFDDAGLPRYGAVLDAYALDFELQGGSGEFVDFVYSKFQENQFNPYVLVKALFESVEHCEQAGGVLCINLLNSESIKEALVASAEDSSYSDADRAAFAEYARLTYPFVSGN